MARGCCAKEILDGDVAYHSVTAVGDATAPANHGAVAMTNRPADLAHAKVGMDDHQLGRPATRQEAKWVGCAFIPCYPSARIGCKHTGARQRDAIQICCGI